MIEIQHRVQATVAGAELAPAVSRSSAPVWVDDPTVANSSATGASRWPEAIECARRWTRKRRSAVVTSQDCPGIAA